MKWHSGFKKPGSLLAVIVGLLAAFLAPDVGQSGLTQVFGSILAALGAGGYIVENKRDTINNAKKRDLDQDFDRRNVADLFTNVGESSFDIDLYHETVILPGALEDKIRNHRDSLAYAAWCVVQAKLKGTGPKHLAYRLGLALGAFHGIWGVTYEKALDSLPEYKEQCLGFDLMSVGRRKGMGHYWILRDTQGLIGEYNSFPPSARAPIFEPNWTQEQLGL